MLDVRRMRVLREVAVRGSFSAAAEALSFTQSAVSQQIAALEREAGTTLVQRSARGVRLTEAGDSRGMAAQAMDVLNHPETRGALRERGRALYARMFDVSRTIRALHGADSGKAA